MSDIGEYELVSGCGLEAFNEKINKMIKRGWQPFGGISVCVDDNNIFYSQAMVAP
jgi:hypothetical protein